MTPYQRIAAKQKALRLNRINEYYQSNPGCNIIQAINYTPPAGETAVMVREYFKLRTELVTDGHQAEITSEDIAEYVYGANPSRHRRNRKLHERNIYEKMRTR